MRASLRRSSGFTLVEIVIALAVATILSAIALPAYSNFNRTQDFNSSVQQIAGCLQRAQRDAASPTGATRFTEAYLTSASAAATANDGLECRVYTFDESATYMDISNQLRSLSPGNALTYDVEVPSLAFNGLTATPGSSAQAVTYADTVLLYFGSTENGRPVALLGCDSTATTCDASSIVPSTSTLSTNGFSVNLSVRNGSQPGADNLLTQTIAIGRLGVPIEVQ